MHLRVRFRFDTKPRVGAVMMAPTRALDSRCVFLPFGSRPVKIAGRRKGVG